MEENFSFGYWLRRQRLARDLRQADLALQLGIAPITLRKIEADERRPSLQLLTQLANLFGLSEIERTTLLKVARADLSPAALPLPEQVHNELAPFVPPQRTLDTHHHNLPAQVTPLIGREREIAELCDRLAQPDIRLLTLIGPGGVGKTRLALQAATKLCDKYSHGVWFVDLAPISDPARVIPTIARALDVRELPGRTLAGTLYDALREQQLLLVLDNFEQVIAAAPDVAALLAAAPKLHMLITSREALRLTAEQLIAVPPLTLPAPGHALPVEQLKQYEAVQLFVERARAVRADFLMSPKNAAAVAEICRRLDGLPLAIELAAARMRLFTAEALLAHLDQRLPLLTGGARDLPVRHQALRSTIAWSYALLSTAEQDCFRRLGAFVGGWNLAAAAAVALLGNIEMLDLLTTLVDKSLVQRSEGINGEPRFTMLETIREFALAQLDAHEVTVVRARHAACFLSFVETAAPELRGPHTTTWLQLLEEEHNNVRTALDWFAECRDREALARVCVAVWWFWWQRGYLREAQHWLTLALASELPPDRQLLAAWLRCALGWIDTRLSDFDAAEVLLTESRELFRAGNDLCGQGMACAGLGLAAQGRSDDQQMLEMMQTALACFREADDHAGIAFTLNWIADVHYLRSNLMEADIAAQAALVAARAGGDQSGEAVALQCNAQVAFARHDYATATAFLTEALVRQRELGDRQEISSCLNRLADVAYHQGEYEKAETLWNQSLELRRALGNRRGVAAIQACLVNVAMRQGELERARSRWRTLLEFTHSIEYQRGYFWALYAIAEIAAAAGRLELAARLMGAAETFGNQHHLALEPEAQTDYEQALAAIRAGLPESAMQAAWEAGRVLRLDEAIAEAEHLANLRNT